MNKRFAAAVLAIMFLMAVGIYFVFFPSHSEVSIQEGTELLEFRVVDSQTNASVSSASLKLPNAGKLRTNSQGTVSVARKFKLRVEVKNAAVSCKDLLDSTIVVEASGYKPHTFDLNTFRDQARKFVLPDEIVVLLQKNGDSKPSRAEAVWLEKTEIPKPPADVGSYADPFATDKHP